MKRKPTNGFTLIELMIVVVIIGILAGIAYPSYTGYMRQTRRSDAQIALLKVAAAQEKFFADCNTYATWITAARTLPCTGASGLGFTSAASPNNYYSVGVAVTASGAAFTATATPTPGNVQASDADCTTLTINQLGIKSATGAKPTTCWKK